MNRDLSRTFEQNGSIEITVQGRSLLVALAGADPTEPYTWTPANSAEVVAFEAYIRGLPASQRAATITLRNFVPPGVMEQTIQLLDGWYDHALSYTATPNRPQIVDVLGGGFFRNFVISGTGRIELNFASTAAGSERQRKDLSPAFEQNGSVSLTFNGTTVTAPLFSDTSDPYRWIPDNSAEWLALATAILNAGSGNRAATLVIRDFRPADNLHSQEIKLLDGWYDEAPLGGASWDAGNSRQAVAISNSLKDVPTNARFFGRTGFNINTGRVKLYIGSTRTDSGLSSVANLSNIFEQQGTLTCVVGSNELTVALAGMDTSEPYSWIPANNAEVIVFATAVQAINGDESGTLTIRDYDPERYPNETSTNTSAFYLKDSAGNLRQATDIWTKDNDGNLRKWEAAWIKDTGGNLRQIFGVDV